MNARTTPATTCFSAEEAGRRINEWFSVMEISHQLLIAGLRTRLKPGEDEWTAYRRWYQQQMDEHVRTLEHMAQRLGQCLAAHDP